MPEPGAATPDAPRRRRGIQLAASVAVVVLLALLGFAIVVQVHQNSGPDSLSGLREDDLVGILDEQNTRADRLRDQIASLETELRQLRDSGDQSAAARAQAESDLRALGVLLGTLPAAGPGVQVTVTDPDHKLRAADLLAVVEELRGAGAEAISVGGLRVSTSSAFTDDGDTVLLDSTMLSAPYSIVAIGPATTLATALNIPGGVAAAVRAVGGQLTATTRDTLTIRAVRALPAANYASPAPSPSGS